MCSIPILALNSGQPVAFLFARLMWLPYSIKSTSAEVVYHPFRCQVLSCVGQNTFGNRDQCFGILESLLADLTCPFPCDVVNLFVHSCVCISTVRRMLKRKSQFNVIIIGIFPLLKSSEILLHDHFVLISYFFSFSWSESIGEFNCGRKRRCLRSWTTASTWTISSGTLLPSTFL